MKTENMNQETKWYNKIRREDALYPFLPEEDRKYLLCFINKENKKPVATLEEANDQGYFDNVEVFQNINGLIEYEYKLIEESIPNLPINLRDLIDKMYFLKKETSELLGNKLPSFLFQPLLR